MTTVTHADRTRMLVNDQLGTIVRSDRFRSLERIGPVWDDGLAGAPPTWRLTIETTTTETRLVGTLDEVVTQASAMLAPRSDPLATTQPMRGLTCARCGHPHHDKPCTEIATRAYDADGELCGCGGAK